MLSVHSHAQHTYRDSHQDYFTNARFMGDEYAVGWFDKAGMTHRLVKPARTYSSSQTSWSAFYANFGSIMTSKSRPSKQHSKSETKESKSYKVNMCCREATIDIDVSPHSHRESPACYASDPRNLLPLPLAPLTHARSAATGPQLEHMGVSAGHDDRS